MIMHLSQERSGLFGRLRTSDAAFAAAAALITLLLASFYAVLMVNMDSMSSKTEALKEHPYTVTVAAGRAETLLMQVRTLDDRLVFANTPETVASIRTEFDRIDEEVHDALSQVAERHRGNVQKAQGLVGQYDDFRVAQNALVELAESGAPDAEVAQFLAESIDPRIDAMLVDNSEIIKGAARSFDQLYETMSATRTGTVLTATVLMVAVIGAFSLFIVTISRKNKQQEQLQESLRKAVDAAQEASKAKSRFLSNVSHDIRTPLTAIIGLTDIALERTNDPDRVEESLAKIKLSSHHLLNLVNDVLDMSKIERGQVDISHEAFDLRTTVEALVSIVRPQADTKHLSFKVARCDVSEGLVKGDEMRVSQILINLLGNAVKYTEPFGLVRFSIMELLPDEIEQARREGLLTPDRVVPAGQRTRAFRFVVEDNGIGMSEEFVARIFDPFEREDVPTRFSVEGTGLGMAIAKSLVECIGGTIGVESARGRGTRFTLTLPFEACEVTVEEEVPAASPKERAKALHQAPAKETPAAGDTAAAGDSPTAGCCCRKADAPRPRPRDGAWVGARVLLAEDDVIVGEIAETLIQRTGAVVDRAWNGCEALDLLKESPAGAYDLVFMDVQMPRMDGLQAARTIVQGCERDGCDHPPIIAMTANAYVEDRKRALDAGMDGYAVKPISQEEIYHLFETYVRPCVVE